MCLERACLPWTRWLIFHSCFQQAHFPGSFSQLLWYFISPISYCCSPFFKTTGAVGGKKGQVHHWYVSPRRTMPFGHELGIVLKSGEKQKRNLSSSCSQLWEGFSVEDCVRKRVSLNQIAILDVLLLPDALALCQAGQVSLLYYLCKQLLSAILNEEIHRKIPGGGVQCTLN